jgi:hypothetical protein
VLAFKVVPLHGRQATIAASVGVRGSEEADEVPSASDVSKQETRGMVLSLEYNIARNGAHALLSPKLYKYEGILLRN